MHRSMLSSISGLSPLDAGNASPVMGIKDVSRHCQMFSVGQNPPLARELLIERKAVENGLGSVGQGRPLRLSEEGEGWGWAL